MITYPKIESIYNRDSKTKKFIEGQYRQPEFEYLKNNEWIWTEKIDGINIRVGWMCNTYWQDKVCFLGRTGKAETPPLLLSRLHNLFASEKLSKVFAPPDRPDIIKKVILFGEGFGLKIQKGGKYIPDGVDFILFDVWIDGWWLMRKDVEAIAEKLGIRVVPVINTGTLIDAVEKVKNKEIMSTFGNFLAEGLVVRPKVDLYERSVNNYYKNNRIITKIKVKDF